MNGSLKKLLNRYKDGNGNHYTDGDWSIGKGGYDLWFEIYYQNIPKFQCVDGVIQVGNSDNIDVKKCLKTITEVFPELKIEQNN